MADDMDLRARLDALKKSSALPPVEPEHDETDELVDRFLRFRSTSPKAGSTRANEQPSEEDSKTLKELLADVPSAEQWNVDPLDEKNIQKLIKEAQDLMPTEDEEGKEPEGGPADKTTNEVGSTQDSASHPQEERDEEADADEALRQILDELGVEDEEATSDGADARQHPEPMSPKPSTSEHATDAGSTVFELPSTPSTAPVAKMEAVESKEGENDIVQLPSAPTAQPSATKKSEAKPSSLKKYTDEEIDSWCIICNDDATVRCIGCDGELYCASCWKEGHVGPDIGYEERLHRCVKFTRDRTSAS